MTDDEKVAQRYRELGAEEPSRALDDAILAAARRGRPRSYAPLATAAVLVLALAVTLNMQFERPGIESPAPQPAPQRADQPAAVASSPEAKEELKLKATADLKRASKPAAEADSSARRRDAGQAASVPLPAPAAPAVREPQPFAANQAQERAAVGAGVARDSRGPASSVTGESARQMEDRSSRDAAAAERAPRMGAVQSLAKRAEPADSPERELERIAELRGQGRHEDADKALAEFRKRYPAFRIPDTTRERVERR